MEKKFRGEIPFWLKSKKNNIVYVCSSNRNIDDYFFVLKDIYKGKVLRIKKENENDELKKYNYDLLELINSDEKYIILISIEYFLEKYFTEVNSLFVRLGERVELKFLEEKLQKAGFEKTFMVSQRNEYSTRGDILDIFNTNQENPIRVEFFGDEIDRITYFDINSQLSIEKKESIELYIDNNNEKKYFFDLISMNKNKIDYFFENKDILEHKIYRFFNEEKKEKEDEIQSKYIELINNGTEIEIKTFTENELKQFEVIDKVKKLSENLKIKIYSEEAERYKEIFKGYDIKFEKYPLFEGYKIDKELILTDREIKGIRVKREKIVKKDLKLKNIDEIREEDYVIHENFGVGIFLGIENIDGKDYLKIKYDEDKLFVPIESVNRLEKYINMSEIIPEIYNLGRKGFRNKKLKLTEDIEIFAREIIKIQAKRNLGNGFNYSKDTVWQEEFEEAFPYTETPAQKKAIEDVKADMESSKVMDRLVCGDVGYGKTEVAIRAAFKAVMDHKQVALLVPTTVLAEQHFERFSERFKNYPINIDILSRVKSDREQRESLKKIKAGAVDLIIGTHRILSNDIKFKDLGLLIIDEEQKFGVKAKEKLKKIKGDIDVLTLTATPIPRTLNMSLLGIRDLSIIDTSPEGRQKTQTMYIDNNKEEIKEILMKEISREGQAYYIFNSVKRIESKTEEIKSMLPDYIKVSYIHGQMSPYDIKKNIHEFENGNIDILVATTIIENGIDIENANTMIIEGVEKLGLSQVYQLRGRIGRSSRKSYCYLLMNDNKTKNAKKREESIKEFDNLMGIDLAMEDSKIRGVGEILGEKQHGAVETFGYNLYMKMLTEEISKIKGENQKQEEIDIDVELNFPRYLPEDYVGKIEKIKLYKRALKIKTLSELEIFKSEIEDRFGRMKEEAKGFLDYLKIRIIGNELGIKIIKQHGEEIYINFNDEKVNLDKIIFLMNNNKIKFLQFTNTIVYKGDIFNFFTLYTK